MIMRIGIIGAGFTGLTAAYYLQKKGATVSLFEQEATPGGLAMGFREPAWEWSLEKHYHHIFTSDTAIRTLAREVNVPFIFSRPNTSSLVDSTIRQLDSPLKLLMFDALSIPERMRMGAVLGYLRYLAGWRELEGYKAHTWLSRWMGKRPYDMLWEPLLQAKFGPAAHDISLAWFWARIKARTTQLGYPDGGFQQFADTIAQEIVTNGGSIHYSVTVQKIEEKEGTVRISGHGFSDVFDAVIVTVPNILFAALAPSLPEHYRKELRSFKGIGAVNMVLELDIPFFPGDVYWLNICDTGYPFLAVVEHTHFVDKAHYDNTHLVYVGNYVPHQHRYFRMTSAELLDTYHPHLDKLHPGYRTHVKKTHLFKVPFAQPIVTTNFSRKILPFATPLQQVYLANMQQVYPWDRGTNFAVDLGQRVAEQIPTTG